MASRKKPLQDPAAPGRVTFAGSPVRLPEDVPISASLARCYLAISKAISHQGKPGRTGSRTALKVLQGVGIGRGLIQGAVAGEPTLVVFTMLPMSIVEFNAAVKRACGPSAVPGKDVPVEILWAGLVEAQNPRRWIRPAPAGVSVGNAYGPTGTIGAFARGASGARSQRLLMLSNNHVLARLNWGAAGEPILQPGTTDGGSESKDQIGTLERFVHIDQMSSNSVDAATAILDPCQVDPEFRHAHYPAGQLRYFKVNNPPTTAHVGMIVGKAGRSTGLTAGVVIATSVNVTVTYDGGVTADYTDQIAVAPLGFPLFTARGDSGSLVWSWMDRKPVGLHFAGGWGVSFANPIQPVLKALDIELLP